MKATIRIEIECGKTTCASKPGHFCSQLCASHLGTRWNCAAFGNKEVKPPRDNEEGWLQRLPECVAATKKESKSGKS